MSSSAKGGVGVLRRGLPALLLAALVATTGASAGLALADASGHAQAGGTARSGHPSAGGTPNTQAPGGQGSATASPASTRAQRADVRAVVSSYVDASRRMLSHPSVSANPVRKVATDDFAARLVAARDELERSGVAQSGSARIVDVHVRQLRLDGSPPTARVRVCLDTSNVELVDAKGHRVQKQRASTDRTWHDYVLVKRGSTWLIDREVFPDDPDC